MYQMIYPWITSDQFQVTIPVEQNPLWPQIATQVYDMLEKYKLEHASTQIRYHSSRWMIEPDEELTEAPNTISVHSAAEKLCAFIERRDVNVIYHGPDECTEKKYWNCYDHFHLTYVSQTRPGCDKMWLGVTAQHKHLADTLPCQLG